MTSHIFIQGQDQRLTSSCEDLLRTLCHRFQLVLPPQKRGERYLSQRIQKRLVQGNTTALSSVLRQNVVESRQSTALANPEQSISLSKKSISNRWMLRHKSKLFNKSKRIALRRRLRNWQRWRNLGR